MIPQSIIFDTLPDSAIIGGREYGINSGYRTMMAVEITMFQDIPDDEKLCRAFSLFFKDRIPEDIQAAVDYLLWFYRCGEEVGTEKKEKSKAPSLRGYDFLQDAGLIYSAFRQQYGINLKRTANAELHWWEFKALFNSMNEEVKMAKVIYWRTCDLKGLSKHERKFVARMRKLYALESPDSTMDSKTKLAKRNNDMKAYVRRRAQECLKKG